MGKKNNGKRRPLTGTSLNWHTSDSQAKRRRNALSSRKGDYLATARALQRVANNKSLDYETCRKARSDALYFFMKHKQKKMRGGKR